MWREEVGLVEMLFTYIGEIKEFESYEAWKPVLVDILSSHEEARRRRISFATAYITEEVDRYANVDMAMKKFGESIENPEAPLMDEHAQHWQSHEYAADTACQENYENFDKKTKSSAYSVEKSNKIINSNCVVEVKEDITDEDESGKPLMYDHHTLQLEGNDDESTPSFYQGREHFGESQYESLGSRPLNSGRGDTEESDEVPSTRYVESECNPTGYMDDENSVTAMEDISELPFSTERVTEKFGVSRYRSSIGRKRTALTDTDESANDFLTAANFGSDCYSRVSSTDKRNFRCKICGSCFKTKSYLKIHLRYHSGERPYQCHMCDKSYCQQCDLNKHLRSHNGERPFNCPMCPKSFALKWIMKRHLATHNKYDVYSGKPR